MEGVWETGPQCMPSTSLALEHSWEVTVTHFTDGELEVQGGKGMSLGNQLVPQRLGSLRVGAESGDLGSQMAAPPLQGQDPQVWRSLPGPASHPAQPGTHLSQPITRADSSTQQLTAHGPCLRAGAA